MVLARSIYHRVVTLQERLVCCPGTLLDFCTCFPPWLSAIITDEQMCPLRPRCTTRALSKKQGEASIHGICTREFTDFTGSVVTGHTCRAQETALNQLEPT